MKRPILSLLVPCLLTALPASATVVLDLPLPDLAHRSSLVVRGVVTARAASWDIGHHEITTRATVKVLEAWRGNAPPSGVVVVDQPGGEVDGIGEHVEGAASFRTGEEVVLFLEPHRTHSGEYTLVSLAAAKFTVVRTGHEPTAVRDLSGLTFASPDAHGRAAPTASSPASTVALHILKAAARDRSAP